MALKFLAKGLLDRLIVCEDDDWGAVGNPHIPIPDDPRIVTFRKFVEGAPKPAQWPSISADDVALLQYTGGTTGLPKGAMLSHGNLTSAVSMYDVWGAPARAERNTVERVICVLPLFHIFALTVVLLASLKHGYLISLHQRFEIEAVMRDIENEARHRISPACRRCGLRSPACPISTSAICRRWSVAAPAARRCRSRSPASSSAGSA